MVETEQRFPNVTPSYTISVKKLAKISKVDTSQRKGNAMRAQSKHSVLGWGGLSVRWRKRKEDVSRIKRLFVCHKVGLGRKGTTGRSTRRD